MKKLAVTASFPLFLAAVRFLPLNRLPSTCVFYHVTGYPCPGCGMTRAMIALTRLDLGRAMHLHPLVMPLLGVLALLWGMLVYEAVSGRRTAVLAWVGVHVAKLVLWAFGILLAFGALRIVAEVFGW